MRARRLLPAFGLLAGAAALVFGLLTLQRIFLREREATVAGMAARRRALEQFASQAFAEALSARLSAVEAQITQALRDPLVPDRGLLLAQDGRALLPRAIGPVAGDAAPARSLHELLRKGRGPLVEAGSPLAERIAAYRALGRALDRRDDAAIEESFRAFLAHRVHYVLPASEDLPLAVAALEALSERAQPRVELLRGLLREGLSDGSGRIALEGLQRALLARRTRLTAGDLEFLAEKISRLSQRAGALHDDFDARVRERDPVVVPLPADLRAVTLLADAGWYIEPHADGSVHGVAVPVDALLSEVAAGMRRSGLLPNDGVARLTGTGAMALSGSTLRIESSTFEREAAEARLNQRVKAAWGLFCGLLTALLVGLGVLWVRQERKYLDLKSDFVATVSHELRTPLASVRLLAETLGRRLGPDSGARDYPERIVRDVDRLGFLVENILSFNRISRAGIALHRTDVNLGEIVDAVHLERSDGRDVLFSSAGSAECWLRADPELLHLLFSNLYENACRYSSRRPVRITVTAETNGRGLEVLFADNGDGLSRGDEERVFLEFYRAGGDALSRSKGSGLGLAICRQIATLHGGTIRVMKSGPDGTTFGLRLPLS
ncbi:MAG: HAMP domain-containing sensor histidine kinase [Thermoanaerobaculia bacterium]